MAVIGGQTHRFRPLVNMYKEAYLAAGHPENEMKISLHSLGFVGDHHEATLNVYFPGYRKMFNKVGEERGWAPVTREGFDFQADKDGALVVGNPENVAKKILRHAKALGGIDRFTFQMDNPLLSHEQLMRSIELIGKEVIPELNRIESDTK